MQTLEDYIPRQPVAKKAVVGMPPATTPAAPPDIPPSYFVSISYDGEKRACCVRLYEPTSHRVYEWYDTTGHKPYCFADKSPEELSANEAISKNPGFDKFELVDKYDALRGQRIGRAHV